MVCDVCSVSSIHRILQRIAERVRPNGRQLCIPAASCGVFRCAHINLLEEAAEHKVPCAVVTGAQRHSADVSLDLLGIRKYFAVIITQEDTAFRKPDPHPYLLASEHIGVSPAKCCAFEDTTIGITSAKSAGMFCIGIHHEGNTPMELAETDLMIQDFNDLKFECNGRSIKISATITS